jgi:hypothetical protein
LLSSLARYSNPPVNDAKTKARHSASTTILVEAYSWYASLTPTKQMLVQDGIVWGAALLCLWWIARGLTLHKLLETLESANLWLFIPANVISFFIWWLGDTLLFAVLFSFVHKKTKFREL